METERIKFEAVPPDMSKSLSLTSIRESNKPYMVICLDSSIPYRRWKYESWGKVAQWLHQQYWVDICFVGERCDRRVKDLMKNHDSYINDYIEKTSILEWMRLIKYSRLVMSVDSGIIHVAAALGIPSVCLRGFYESGKYSPYRVNGGILLFALYQ